MLFNQERRPSLFIDFSKTFNCLSDAVVSVLRNFEHSCDSVANFQDGNFEKITITVTEVVLIQVFFLAVGSKHKIKTITRNYITL